MLTESIEIYKCHYDRGWILQVSYLTKIILPTIIHPESKTAAPYLGTRHCTVCRRDRNSASGIYAASTLRLRKKPTKSPKMKTTRSAPTAFCGAKRWRVHVVAAGTLTRQTLD
jgi:hypothetical protein